MAIPTATTKAECQVGLHTGKTVVQASFLAGKAVVLPLSCGLTPSGHIAGGRAMHFYCMLTDYERFLQVSYKKIGDYSSMRLEE
ncbi:TPA: hypothetical protein ACP61A_004345 [Escherichia coli]|uniref:hypothetical protein n=1 Tax=Escherichia coli TaxID=562 RepID=UPI0013B3CD6D|nr:hypothetical protein [Escherichia coli]